MESVLTRPVAGLILVLLCITWAFPTLAVESIDERVLQSLLFALREEDQSIRLEKLAKLANRYRNNPAQQAYVLLERASLLVQAEQIETARDELQQLLDAQPPDFFPAVQLALGRLLLALDDIEGATTILENWYRAEPQPDPQGRFLMGYAYVRSDRYDDAIRILETLRSEPTARKGWLELLAYSYAQAGRMGEAIELMIELVTADPLEGRKWKQLSSFYHLNEDIHRGAASLAIVAELDELTANEQIYLGRLFAYVGMPYDGAVLMEQVLASGSREEKRYDDYLVLGRTWAQAREFDKAVDVLTKATQIADDGRAWLDIGQIQLLREDYASAYTALQQSVLAYHEDVPSNVHYLLALAAINVDKLQVARNSLAMIADDDEFTRRRDSLLKFVDQNR